MSAWYKGLRCWWSGHTDQHCYADGSMTCGRCGVTIVGDRSLKGHVTIHFRPAPITPSEGDTDRW